MEIKEIEKKLKHFHDKMEIIQFLTENDYEFYNNFFDELLKDILKTKEHEDENGK